MIDTIYSDPDFLEHHGVKGMKWGVRKDRSPNVHEYRAPLKTAHYNRNSRNLNLPNTSKEAIEQGWHKLSRKSSSLHQHVTDGIHPNTKWVDKTGKREVVFSGRGKTEKIVNDIRDAGTYNFSNPERNPLGHALLDVIPYYIWGNGPEDIGTIGSRLNESIDTLFDKPLTETLTPISDIGEKWLKKNKIA